MRPGSFFEKITWAKTASVYLIPFLSYNEFFSITLTIPCILKTARDWKICFLILLFSPRKSPGLVHQICSMTEPPVTVNQFEPEQFVQVGFKNYYTAEYTSESYHIGESTKSISTQYHFITLRTRQIQQGFKESSCGRLEFGVCQVSFRQSFKYLEGRGEDKDLTSFLKTIVHTETDDVHL